MTKIVNILFTLWGGIGLLLTLSILFNIGGTAATSEEFVSAITLQWIGGTVFFGFAAVLLSNNKGQQEPPSDIRISE
jgi:hypothetical protein